MITKPTLPPKKGYVEVEVDGVRTYRNVETGELIDNETPHQTESDRLAALEADVADLTMAIEEGLAL